MFLLFIHCCSYIGIINTEGAMWKDQRKFLHDKLRHFGMTYLGAGRKVMESRIMVSVNYYFLSLIYFLKKLEKITKKNFVLFLFSAKLRRFCALYRFAKAPPRTCQRHWACQSAT